MELPNDVPDFGSYASSIVEVAGTYCVRCEQTVAFLVDECFASIASIPYPVSHRAVNDTTDFPLFPCLNCGAPMNTGEQQLCSRVLTR